VLFVANWSIWGTTKRRCGTQSTSQGRSQPGGKNVSTLSELMNSLPPVPTTLTVSNLMENLKEFCGYVEPSWYSSLKWNEGCYMREVGVVWNLTAVSYNKRCYFTTSFPFLSRIDVTPCRFCLFSFSPHSRNTGTSLGGCGVAIREPEVQLC
jgi:hypothetical protein